MLKNLCSSSVTRNFPCSVICVVPNRSCSQDIRPIKFENSAALKRGTGGRSSFNGKVVTVFGATGFLGKFICNQLGKRGSQLIIPYRCDSDDPTLKGLKLCGDLGQVLFQPFDLRDPLSIRKAIKYSNVVVNLIGTHYETANFDMYSVNTKGAAEIAKACREMNVERLIHFSAMNVTEHPKRHVYKASKFFPTKLAGEKAVFEEFPDATVFRPGSVYGVGDKFIWPMFSPHRRVFKTPFYAKGNETTKIPVWGKDVSQAVVSAIDNYETKGQIYQAIGPERYYLSDLAYFCFQVCQRSGKKEDLIKDIKFDPIFPLKMIFVNNIQGFFLSQPRWNLNFDLIEIESTTDYVHSSLPTLTDLGVSLSRFEDYIPSLISMKFSAANIVPFDEKEMIDADSLSPKALSLFPN